MTASCAAATSGSPATLFAHLIQTLLSAQCALADPNMYPPDRSEEILRDPNEEFDFVIVGGGSAGSVVASRLSEIENWKILLIEAGENPSSWSEIPSAFMMQVLTSEAYDHFVEPEKLACHGSKNKLCRWASGKALGGSSTLNAMLYIYGNEEDYNEWSRMGNEGWNWDEVLPYFKKSHNSGNESKLKTKYWGQDGPLSVRPYNYTYKHVFDMFLEAARELDIPTLDVINNGEFIGYGRAYGTLDKGRRMSVSKSFLSPTKIKKNLYVMKSTRADSILLDGTRAYGVRVTLKDGRTIDVKASKEVILSASSIGSSRILLLSGIGPEQHLRDIGIPSVVDLPVGQNLQDHITWIGLQLTFKNESTATPLPPTFALDGAYNYFMYHKGLFADSSGVDFLGFVNVHDPTSKYPDIQYHHVHVLQWHTFLAKIFLDGFYMDNEIIEEMIKMLEETDIITVWPTLLKPKSRGEVQLRSKDPAEPVKIYANYFSEQEDLETMLRSLDFLKKMINTEAMKRQNIKLQHLDLPGCRHTEFDTDEYWRCNLRYLSSTIFHPVGTAKMGPPGDPTAVVDSQLKVHGVQGLRVIDASIMPTITSGNTNAPTIMIGEKGADFIKKDWSFAARKHEL